MMAEAEPPTFGQDVAELTAHDQPQQISRSRKGPNRRLAASPVERIAGHQRARLVTPGERLTFDGSSAIIDATMVCPNGHRLDKIER
jgi:hypothetical protein